MPAKFLIFRERVGSMMFRLSLCFAAVLLIPMVARAQFDLPAPSVDPPGIGRKNPAVTPAPVAGKPELPPGPPIRAPMPSVLQPGGMSGRAIRVGQRQTHPNGMTMTVDAIEFRPAEVVIMVSIINSSGRRVRLSRSNSLLLTDDRGIRYTFLPPPENPELQIAPQSRVAGALVFLGRTEGSARSMRFSTNEGVGGSPTDRLTRTPLFLFHLPGDAES
ncbi:hypothetical protein KXS07_36450 [Inquilinus limosus]|uniref:hypothetical protein n=1 Tax=Inquilinus limosus TaxID=171674 RepID=UPI003F183F73